MPTRIRFPRASGHSVERHSSSPRGVEEGKARIPALKSILLVDDDPLVLSMLMRLLARESDQWELTTARNGTEALRHIRDETFDLIVTDVRIPEPDGLEIIREVRRSRPSTRLIALTGGGTEDDVELAKTLRALGADEVVDKPFSAA